MGVDEDVRAAPGGDGGLELREIGAEGDGEQVDLLAGAALELAHRFTQRSLFRTAVGVPEPERLGPGGQGAGQYQRQSGEGAGHRRMRAPLSASKRWT